MRLNESILNNLKEAEYKENKYNFKCNDPYKCPVCGERLDLPLGYNKKSDRYVLDDDGWFSIEWKCKCGAEGIVIFTVNFWSQGVYTPNGMVEVSNYLKPVQNGFDVHPSFKESADPKKLEEAVVYRDTEDPNTYLTVDGNKLTDTSVGNIITDDFGEFVGITQVEQTKYIVMRKDNKLYIYSFDAGFPYIFKEE